MSIRLASARGALLFVLVPLLCGACVSKQRHGDMERAAQHYQDRLHETEARLAQSERDRERLRQQLDASGAYVREATDTTVIDARLEELRALLAKAGQGQHDEDWRSYAVDGGYVIEVTDKVLFALGSAEVSADGRSMIQLFATDIQKRPHGTVYVRGHTDTTPIVKAETKARFPHGNLQLSTTRAVEVAALLMASGVEDDTVVVMGFGQWDPIAPNDNADNKRRNRRVEIFVADPAAQAGGTGGSTAGSGQ